MSGGNPVGLSGRLAKLRAMSVPEMATRVGYAVQTALDKRGHARQAIAAPDRLERALLRSLRGGDWASRLVTARRGATARFLPGAHERARIQALFAGPYRTELQATVREAALARERRFEFFGQVFDMPLEIDWHADPVSGRRWPAVYHGDVLVHGGDGSFGDVKYVWEPGRQQYVIDLAKAHFLTGSCDDLEAMRHLVSSWIAGNPYATGVHWACALEPAFRAWSWLWAYYLTADHLDEEFHVEWLLGFYDHGRFLFKHLELYASPYNHLIGEASALYTLGVCFPEFRDSRSWRRRGRKILESRLPRQFYGDGGSVEQSTFYHHATTGFYLLAALLARANGEELALPVWNGIERALEFSMYLSQPDGRTPEIGGADDGKPIRMEHLPFWDFRPYQAIGAVLFGRPDFKNVAGRFYEDALWLLGPVGLERFTQLESRPPANTSVVLDRSGYVMSRSNWSAAADYVCFDVGEQAAAMRTDAVPNSMHGHADCLSVLISLGGRRVLIDSGLYAYNCGGEWEAHFRETAAHNTARIDGRDQARHIGKMAWSHSYRATIEARGDDARQSWTTASHDGYSRGPEGVTHRRTVWRRPGGYVLVYDEFTGHGHHDLEVNYQFAPGELELLERERRARFDGFAEVAWFGGNAWTADARRGGPGPHEGWICGSLGVREPAPRLSLRNHAAAMPLALLTVVADFSRPARIVAAGRGACLGVLDAHGVDWIAARGITTSRAIDSDAPLAVCRVEAAAVVESISAGGTYLRADSDELRRLAGVTAAAGGRGDAS